MQRFPAISLGERFDTPNNGWLKRLLTRKPRMVAAIALANKMARGLWAMMTKQEDYRNPAAKIARHDVPVSWGCEEVTEQ